MSSYIIDHYNTTGI